MIRYVVTELGPETPAEQQQKLLAALETIQGIKNIAVDTERRQIQFQLTGAEPKPKLLKEACETAGFTLGQKQ